MMMCLPLFTFLVSSGLRMAASVDNLLAVRGAGQSNTGMEDASEAVATGGTGGNNNTGVSIGGVQQQAQPDFPSTVPDATNTSVVPQSLQHHRETSSTSAVESGGASGTINSPSNVHVSLVQIST